jgi:hypothetical protein
MALVVLVPGWMSEFASAAPVRASGKNGGSECSLRIMLVADINLPGF